MTTFRCPECKNIVELDISDIEIEKCTDKYEKFADYVSCPECYAHVGVSGEYKLSIHVDVTKIVPDDVSCSNCEYQEHNKCVNPCFDCDKLYSNWKQQIINEI